MHPTTALVAPLLLMAALASPVSAQQPGSPAGGGGARAEAHANATNGESRTATHRVVVVNGKTVVDERTESGKPVGGGAGGGAGGVPAPMPGCPSPDELLRQLQEQIARDMAAQGAGLPMPPASLPPVLPPKPASQPRPPVAPKPAAQPRPPVAPPPGLQPRPPAVPRPAKPSRG